MRSEGISKFLLVFLVALLILPISSITSKGSKSGWVEIAQGKFKDPSSDYEASLQTSRIWGHDSIGTPTAATDWYLAEGCTAEGFETWVLVQNPGDTPANIQVTYMTPEGAKPGPSEALPPNSRKTYNVSDTVPGSWQVSTKVHSDEPVVAERAMYGAGRSWGTDSIGASSPSKTWYLAEGCTAGGFETWVLVQNPNEGAADVSLTYMTPQGPETGPSMSLPPNSRQTFNVADTVPGSWEVSTLVTSGQPVVAERAVYWNDRKGAHDSVGVTSPDTTWYLAEGSTNAGFETYILVQNPGGSPASVDLTYMTETGQVAGPHLDLAPHSRQTVNVADKVPSTWSVSTRVTSRQPVIAERAVYWNNRIEGHDSIGTTSPANTWYLAEGSTGAGFETWILVQNPTDVPAHVELTYMTLSGPVEGPSETLAPNSRKTFNAADIVPGNFEVSTKVTADLPVIAERAMYGNATKAGDGRRLVYGAADPASAQNPAFSPDGDTVLFTVFESGYNDGPAGLYTVPTGGGDRTTIFYRADHDSVNLPGASWNAATGRLVFASDIEGNEDIWTIGQDGRGLKRVTRHEDRAYYMEPSFSPDGRTIVFERDTGNTEETQHGSIWRVNSDGTGLTRLTDGHDDRQPNWSPTGERILFQRRDGGDNWDIYTISPDGADIRRVTTSDASDTDASWSPDGKWIVYSTDHGGLPAPNVFIIPAEGGEPVRVTQDSNNEDGAPSWSPDGEQIAFESHISTDETDPASIFLVEVPSH